MWPKPTRPSTAQGAQKKSVKITKPSDGQAITVELGHDQPTKVDLTAIAGENVTLTRIGERLIILFDNRSTVTIEPYLDSMNVAFEVSPGRVVGATEFLTLFSIATTEVSHAAGTPGAPASGADFSNTSVSNTSVEPLETPDRQEASGPLPLLSQEFVPPNWNVNFADPTLPPHNLPPIFDAGLLPVPSPPTPPSPPAANNNPPFITAAVDSGTVTEGPLPVMIAVGSIHFGDVDLTDSHVTAVTPGAIGYLGNFAAILTNASTGDGVGRVTWLFAANNALRQSLGVDQVLVQTYTVEIADGHGGIATQSVTITINGTNDAAVITGEATGTVVEDGGVNNGTPGTPTDIGDLNSTDVDDDPADSWEVISFPTASTNGYGTFTIDAAGVWTYTLDNNNTAVQALNVGQTLTDTFTVATVDGTEQVVSITITGANDAAVITGPVTGTAVEAGGVANGGTPGIPTVTRDLLSTDVDNPSDTWQPVAAGAATANGYGTYALTATGVWTYTLDNSNPAVQALNVGQTLTDTFTAFTVDGTSQLVTVTINGRNDAAVISGVANGSVTEAGGVNNGTPGTPTATGDLNSTDVDNPNDLWEPVNTPLRSQFGTYTLTADGVWTYTLDNDNPAVQARNVGQTLTDTFAVFTVDGTQQLVTITITGANDAAVITGPVTGTVLEAGEVNNSNPGTPTATGDLSSSDLDNPNDVWTAVGTATMGANGFGSYTLTAAGLWTYTLDNSNTTVQGLNTGQTLTDTFTATTVDGTQQLVTITINGTNDAAVSAVTRPGRWSRPAVSPTARRARPPRPATSIPPTSTTTRAMPGPRSTRRPRAPKATAPIRSPPPGCGPTRWTTAMRTCRRAMSGEILTDTFTVTTVDGTSQVVTIIITGTNDAAVVSGATTGSVVEAGGVANGTPGTPAATGDLNFTDVDDPNDAWMAVSSRPAATAPTR